MSLHHDKLNARRWEATRRFPGTATVAVDAADPGRLEAHHEPPLRAGGDPYDVDGVTTLCRSCHISHHRRDDMAPDRAAWLDYLSELS